MDTTLHWYMTTLLTFWIDQSKSGNSTLFVSHTILTYFIFTMLLINIQKSRHHCSLSSSRVPYVASFSGLSIWLPLRYSLTSIYRILIKWKTKNRHVQHLIEVATNAKSTPIRHSTWPLIFQLGTGISIKRGGAKLVYWSKLYFLMK